MPTVSICIPTFELGGRGVPMLKQLLDSIKMQTYKDFEVIISDHTANGHNIEHLCEQYNPKMNIVYLRNAQNRGSCEANLNNAILHAAGLYIKPMLQDDFFLEPLALQSMVDLIKREDVAWVGAGCMHCREDHTTDLFYPHNPGWIDGITMALGHNLIGSPSVVMYPNNITTILFDHNLIWLMDCEFYTRLAVEIGPPALLYDKVICIRMRFDSITDSIITPQIIGEEQSYVDTKFKTGIPKDLTKFPAMYKRLQKCNLI
jgi:glycosyltransferase involved in cell wall biosynthesis